MDIVKQVLDKQRQEQEKFKSIDVTKEQEVAIDVGHLMVTDPNNFNQDEWQSNRNEYLLNLTRDNTQLLINEIWKLETTREEEQVVAKLPEPKLPLPRMRKLPEPKPMTRWEKFAKAKGITKRKKDKKVWDEELGQWVPTYGAKRAKANYDKDWILEVPKNVDPMTDMFEKKKDLKQEKVARNEVNRLKNLARAEKVKLPRAPIISTDSASAKQLQLATTIAKVSTASVGKFQDKLPKEKVARGVRELIPSMKRKAMPIELGKEREANLELVTSILKKRPKIDEEKAVIVAKKEAKREREAGGDNEDGGSRKRKSKKGSSKFKGKGGSKKGKGGQHSKPGKKGTFGRKRR